MDILIEAQIIPATWFAHQSFIFPSQIFKKLLQEKIGQVQEKAVQDCKAKKQLACNAMNVSGTKIPAIDFNEYYAHSLHCQNAAS